MEGSADRDRPFPPQARPRFHRCPSSLTLPAAGAPLDLVQPETMRWKVMEPVLLLGKQRFSNVDIRIRVKGGGQVSQIYAIRQAISKGIVAFYQKCECAALPVCVWVGLGGGPSSLQASCTTLMENRW